MARTLPFEVAPAPAYQEIGTDETGKLKFRQRRTVTIPERLAVQEVSRNDELFQAIGQLAAEVHNDATQQKAEGITSAFASVCGESLADAYAVIHQTLDLFDQLGMPRGTGLETELALLYPTELMALRDQRQEAARIGMIRKATVMIQHRLQGCEDWTDQDTEGLGEALILQIALFYEQEVAGLTSTDALLDTHAQLVALQEALGKLRREPGSQPETPTGAISTGTAEPPTQEPESSSPTASASSGSTTSSPPPMLQPSES